VAQERNQREEGVKELTKNPRLRGDEKLPVEPGMTTRD
jgi:hypothetical protein